MNHRVKALEFQISELEAETERLSRSHEAQKKVSSDAQEASIRKISDTAKELQKKVRWFVQHIEYWFIFFQVAEIEQLKQRLKQFGDYDEIKRELEIMKVKNPMLYLSEKSL